MKLNAIVVDVVKKEIYSTEITTDYRDIYQLIGNHCELFACPVEFENGDTMYCDDEGLLKEFFGGIVMHDWVTPIVGNIVILGTDEEGNSCNPKTSIEELKAKIKFLSVEEILNFDYETAYQNI